MSNGSDHIANGRKRSAFDSFEDLDLIRSNELARRCIRREASRIPCLNDSPGDHVERGEGILEGVRVIELELFGTQSGFENQVNVFDHPPACVVAHHLLGLLCRSDGHRADQDPVDRLWDRRVELTRFDGKQLLARVLAPVQPRIEPRPARTVSPRRISRLPSPD